MFREMESVLVSNNSFDWIERVFLASTSIGHICKNINNNELSVWEFIKKNLPNIDDNDLIHVRNNDQSKWIVRHFKEFNNTGLPICYVHGKSKHTIENENEVATWNQYKLYTEKV